MKELIQRLEQEALREIRAAAGGEMLEAARTKYLGRKGLLTEAFKKIGEASAEERPALGSLINEVKGRLGAALDERTRAASGGEEKAEKIDITLPGAPFRRGRIHPITKTVRDISDCFVSLGFMVVEGPEIETEHYNFEALNIPLEHPSRDAFDTFYLNSRSGTQLLRSHTSPVQARFMEKHKPPFAIIVPGRVFRPDATDATHSFMFHQVEGLVVGDRVTFADLKGVLAIFARQMFGVQTRMRFRPSFFPFTEPSAEVDISCFACARQKHLEGRRCSICGGKGWLEILGAGMVNPKVFKGVGYDPEKVTGFAFGMGVERIAMLKYGISDIRLFCENDIRFLRQF
ncbi:MAG: phenylalanine--tRNA ligase subunit alpha [Candidatus Omnitrophica bacterium]|nr:phenylalanine--tRNA ligase subunit alpha [Candidatus Omnitrophota bacterium]